MKIQCPAHIKVSANREQQQLVVTHVELQHNHEVSTAVYYHYPENHCLTPAESGTLAHGSKTRIDTPKKPGGFYWVNPPKNSKKLSKNPSQI